MRGRWSEGKVGVKGRWGKGNMGMKGRGGESEEKGRGGEGGGEEKGRGEKRKVGERGAGDSTKCVRKAKKRSKIIYGERRKKLLGSPDIMDGTVGGERMGDTHGN